MTKRPPSAEELLREMRATVVPVDSPEATQERRDRTISHLHAVQKRELVDRNGARIRRRFTAGIAIIATLAAGFAVYLGHDGREPSESAASARSQTTVRALEGRITVARGGKETQHGPGIGMPLEAGDAVRTSEFRATLTMQSRATIDVGPATNLSLGAPERPRGEWLVLELGRVDVSVPRLEPGRTLSIHTPHAAVIVHGTRFSVVVVPSTGGELRTTVEVREGAVQVEHDGRTIELGSGNVWSSGGDMATPSDSAAHAHPEPPAPTAASEPRTDSPSRTTASSGQRTNTTATVEPTKHSSSVEFPVPATSTLSEENALLQRAMVASRSGDDRTAIAILDVLLERFPNSILKESAQVERLRATRRVEAANVPRH